MTLIIVVAAVWLVAWWLTWVTEDFHAFTLAQHSDDATVAKAAGIHVPTTEGGRSTGQMLADLHWHATTHLPTVLDHVLCEGQCGRVLCNCRPLHTVPRCSGTTEQVCGHYLPLCEFCAPGECFDCLTERLADTGWYGKGLR